MRINKLNIALLLGLLVISGILALQFFLLRQAVQYEEKKFDQKAHVALQEVVSKLNGENKATPGQSDAVEKIKDDYYVVNVNSKFESASLDFYLKNEFDKFDLVTDFEYGIYDCHKETMQYGKYFSLSGDTNPKRMNFAPTINYGPYYFSLHFPQKSKYIYRSLQVWIIFSFVMLIVLVLYGYSAYTILQQKRYSNLQKEFINNMTHEFKTPISSILISSNFLVKQEPIMQDEKLKKYTELIIQQTSKLNNHVEKILNLARTENNSLRMQETAVDVVAVINNAAESIRLKHPEIHLRVDAPESCIIRADEFHLSNLVYNLLDNAVKYSADVPDLTVIVQQKDKQVLLSFADKGIGIPQKEIQKVFDKFYRIPGRRSNDVAGFGLGLFYVSRICGEHKWQINLKSKESIGTEVLITIPAYDKKV